MQKLLYLVYRAIRLYVFINSIDVALCNGKFEVLCKLLDITYHAELLEASNQSAECYCFDDSSDAQLPVLQAPGLLYLESYLHLQHVELIQEFENSLETCCSCEQLLLKKQIMAVKFSDRKFSLDLWKTHISRRISNAYTLCV